MHHSDALFYLHASPKHLRKACFATNFTDSVAKYTEEMVSQRARNRNGSEFPTWTHHDDGGKESDTDWDTDESGEHGDEKVE